MNLQPKLILSFGAVAVITLAVSLLGLWQAGRLGAALYEVGVVRLPSIEGLREIHDAKTSLDASARVLDNPLIDDAVRAVELERQTRAWKRAARGRALYEPLPQTAEEAATWSAFVPAWAEWKAAYEARPPTPATFDALSKRVDESLGRLLEINNTVAAGVTSQSISSAEDLAGIRRLMILAAIVAFLAAITCGWLLGRQLSRPITAMASRLTQIAEGDLSAQVAVMSDDEVGQMARAVNDMSARLRDALRKSEEKFARVFFAAPVGIVITQFDDGRIAEANDEFLKIFGYVRDEVIGRTSLDIGLWPNAESRKDMQARISRGTSVMEAQRLHAKDGSIRVLRAATMTMESEGETLIISAMVDVTDRQRAEEELRHSEEKYRELVNGARDVIFAMTVDGVLTAINPEFEHLTGLRREDWIGRRYTELLHPDDVELATALFLKVLANAPRPVTPLRVKTADGRLLISETMLAPQHRNGEVVGLLGVSRDVTERVLLEQQFLQAQKMEAVGRLAGSVAHDFNNLLTVISGFSDLALGGMKSDDPGRGDLEQIAKAAETAATLTRQLLAFSRRQVLHTKVLSLNDVVGDARKLLTRLIGADVALTTALDATGPIRADAGQLEQVIMNLAVNARDAMPAGGTLSIATRDADLSPADLAGRADGHPGPHVLLSMTDTGTGMSPETQARIFEPFFTTKEVGKGTGLGLATVLAIVKQSGGFVWVDSAVGHGTTFTIGFPRAAEPSDATTISAAAPRRGTETILIVDDADGVRAIARQILERWGYTTLEAASGAAALKVGASFPSDIHLVLVDVVMPDMRGPELAARFSELRPKTRTLFMSGHTDDAVLRPGILDRGLAYLVKPFSPEKLARAVREILDVS